MNVLVEKGDVRLMIDFGFFSPPRLNAMGRSIEEITHVAVSHIHADHVGGLEELAFMSRFVHQRRATLLLPAGIADDIWSTTLRGGLEWIADDHGEPYRCSLDTYFDTCRLADGWVGVGALAIKAFPVDHVPGKKCYGFIVRDTETDEQMIFGCDVRRRLRELDSEPVAEDFRRGPIVHDCQLFDDGPSRVHIPFEQLLGYARGVRERIVLVHYNDTIEEHLPRIYEAGFKVAWPGDVIRIPGWRDCLQRVASG